MENNITIIINYLLDHWQVIVATLLSSTVVATIVQIIKKHWNLDSRLQVWRIEASKFITLLLGLVASLFALADAVITNGTVLTHYLPQAASILPVIFMGANLVHRFALSGLWKRMEAFLLAVRDYRASTYAKPVPATVEPVQVRQFE
jgi:hypothetical protein